MKWNSILNMLIVIIVITGCCIIVIILRTPPPIDPEPICPQCGPIKWMGIAQVLFGLAALFAKNQLRIEKKMID